MLLCDVYLHTKAIFFNIFSEQFFCRVFLGGRRVVAASELFFQIRVELFYLSPDPDQPKIRIRSGKSGSMKKRYK